MPLRRMLRTIIALAVAVPIAVVETVSGGAGPAYAEAGRPPADRQLLFYNHAYGVLDRETADAIEHSDYLRVFANVQIRTTTGADGQTWTGRYLLGRETYLELFGVGDLPGKDGTLGSAGLGLSVERSGDLAIVVDRLRELGIAEPIRFRQTRDFGDGIPVPWFDAVFTSGEYDAFGAWGMEYPPEYFADPRAGTEPAGYPGDVGRERYLSDGYQDRLTRDITLVHLAVTALDLANTVPLLRAGGFLVRSTPDGVLLAYRGGTTLRFDTVGRELAGLRRVEFALNRPVADRHEERLGRSTLVVGPGPTAAWTFPAGTA